MRIKIEIARYQYFELTFLAVEIFGLEAFKNEILFYALAKRDAVSPACSPATEA